VDIIVKRDFLIAFREYCKHVLLEEETGPQEGALEASRKQMFEERQDCLHMTDTRHGGK